MFPAAEDRAGLSPSPAVVGAVFTHPAGAASSAGTPSPRFTSPQLDTGADVGEPIPVRPLTFRERLDLPFAAIQADIRLLAGIGGVAYAVAVGAVAAITALGSIATAGSDAGTAWPAVVSTLLFAWLLRVLMRGLTIPAGLATVHRRPLTRQALWQQLRPNWQRLLLAQLMSTLTGFGVLLLGTPLLITLPPAAVWLMWLRGRRFLITPTLFEESAPYRAAVQRSKTLADGANWPLAGLWLTLRALLVVLVVPLLGLPFFLTSFSGTHRWAVIVLTTAAVLLIAAFAEMVEAAASVTAYLDRRCRREAWDVRIPTLVRGVAR